MKYTTTYDIGDRKREDGINEDSVAVTLLQDGHRDGLAVGGASSDPAIDDEPDAPEADPEPNASEADAEPSVSGPGDEASAGDEPAADADGDPLRKATDVYPDDEQAAAASDSAGPVDRHAGIFVLADGAGGEDAGDVASYLATTVITEELSVPVHRARRLATGGFGLDVPENAFGDPPTDDEIESAIADAVTAAHREVIRYAGTAGSGGTYTTVVVGVRLGSKLHYGWVGDSRAYVVNEAHETISLLTKDHAKVQHWEDDGQIDSVEAHVHPDGNQITRAVGGRGTDDPETATVNVDTRTIPLFREDVVVITSDGLIDAQTDAIELYREYVGADRDEEVGEHVLDQVVTDDDIREIVLSESTLDDAAERFVDFSNEKGGKDNISLILVSDGTLPRSPDPEESGLPERALDPDEDVTERRTVIKNG